MAEQRIVIFAGNVQGVGFRFTACRVAGNYDVTGAARNCADGTVECVVEGEASEIDAFVAELSVSMAGCIRRKTEQTAPASGRFDSFGVTY